MENINNVLNRDISKEMEKSYLEYSMSVIVSRALPDIRDGLKPVHRRILYGMSELNLAPDRPYRKCAKLVGDVLGKYHPHGDTAVYDAMVRLAQDFNMRYPLADGQGNFGSIDGDGAAAMRYTEIRMTKLTLEMLRDINKDTVDFQPNFDESEKEPTVLPSRFPNLLVNGTSGIAVGMATNMAPHNLTEVINGCIAYIDDPEIEVEGLMQYIKGPDFPTGALIMGKEDIKTAYKTGRGKITQRAVANIEEYKNRYRIVVTEIPYAVNKANLVKKIVDLVKEKRLDGISDLRDETNRKGIRIVIEIKRDANPNIVLNNLYKLTQMQTTFGIINLAIVNKEPKILTLKEIIYHYIEHQKEVVTRRTKFDLARAEARAHIIEGLRIAIDNIDEIVKIIRSTYTDEEIKKKFADRFGLTEKQSQAILDMQLKRLSGLQREKLDEEYENLIKEIASYREILGSERVLMNLIKTELTEIKEKYGDKRRTKIKASVGEINIEDMIKEEDVLITLTNQGYVKRLPADTYRVQNRGGKGIVGLTTKEDDFVDTLFVMSSHDSIAFFTNKGRLYDLKAYDIPEGRRQSKGQAIINLLNLEKGEKISALFPISEVKENSYFVMATKMGLIKKIKADLFVNVRKAGIKAIGLNDEDELVSVRLTQENTDIMMVTTQGMCIRFSIDDLRDIGRTGKGVRGIKLKDDDKVVAMDVVNTNKYILVVSEYGFGKKTLISNYKTQSRAGVGVKTYKITPKTGSLISAKIVDINDEIMLVSLKGDIIRLKVRDVSTQGRGTLGVKLMGVDKTKDRIVAVAKYIEETIEE